MLHELEGVGGAHVPQISAPGSGRLLRKMVDPAIKALGGARGWAPHELQGARDHVLAHDLELELVGPWGVDTSREHRVRPVARIADAGLREFCFEVAGARVEVPSRGPRGPEG